jgi:hypothetical protein
MALTKTKLYTIVGVTSAVLVFAVLGTGLVYDVYSRRADDAFAKSIGAMFPAAKVGAHTISYGDFLKSRDTLKTYLNSDLAKQEGMSQPMTIDLEKGALDRLVREQVVKELAAKRDLSVSDQDVKSAYDKFVQEASSSTKNDVPTVIRDTFHWSEAEYRENVIRPILLEQLAAQSLASSTDAQVDSLETYATQRLAQPDVKYYLKF